jgi:hypothetical protein
MKLFEDDLNQISTGKKRRVVKSIGVMAAIIMIAAPLK